jgi:16S rRNA (guanine966-N2)-methyltransferase
VTRIIAGKARGRKLLVPPGEGTRPTSDRAREALFSALDAQLNGFSGLRVLDLFAGSGAVGLEALSRGAAHALLVEADRKAGATIIKNVDATRLNGSVVAVDRVEQVVADAPKDGPYDLVFLDPPYGLPDSDVVTILTALDANGWLRDGAAVVLERSSRDPEFAWPDAYEPTRSKTYGEARMLYAIWYVRGATQD